MNNLERHLNSESQVYIDPFRAGLVLVKDINVLSPGTEIWVETATCNHGQWDTFEFQWSSPFRNVVYPAEMVVPPSGCNDIWFRNLSEFPAWPPVTGNIHSPGAELPLGNRSVFVRGTEP
jgi:hypothetical protein